jgi:threonine/homoserine/homoserine lactone efflux protein
VIEGSRGRVVGANGIRPMNARASVQSARFWILTPKFYFKGLKIMLVYLLQGLTLGLSAAATPGPFQAFLLSQSAQKGWRRTLPAAFSPLVSDGPIIALMVLALSAMPAWLLDGLRLAGGLFLLYLAKNAFCAAGNGSAASFPGQTATRSMLQATAINILNPNPYIFWSLVGGPVLLECWHKGTQYCLAFLGGLYGALIGGCACLIILFAKAARLEQKFNRALLYFSAAGLGLFAVYQLATALAGIMRHFP